jgi:4-amino-4-deoxy-L-arabinose transferase-like glycosyltransferase
MPAEGAAPWEGHYLPRGRYRPALIAVSALGAALRLAHLARPMNGVAASAWNEGHYALIALNFDRYGLWSQRDELGVDATFSPGVPWLIWLAFRLFGVSEWAARLPIVLFGIAAVPLVAAVVRRISRSEQLAFGAAALAAVMPEVVYFAQNVQLDTPSICGALAAAAAILRYRDEGGRAWLVLAGGALAAAVWFKFTTVLLYPAFLLLASPEGRPERRVLGRAAAFAALTLLPSAAWVAHALGSREMLPSFYERAWDLRRALQALIELPVIVAGHVSPPVFLLLAAGIPAALRWRRRLQGVGSWCLPCFLLYLAVPQSALTNRYYDLPATYLLSAVAAAGLWTLFSRRRSGPRPRLWRPYLAALAVLVILIGAYDLWDPTTDRLARTMTPHAAPLDPSPFYSARVVARLPKRRTVVDAPQTMFYAGGDPAWVEIVGGDGDVRRAIDGERYAYIVLNDFWHQQPPYYPLDGALRDRLARHHYVQVAPGAFAHAPPAR